jgi:hypothetical protein
MASSHVLFTLVYCYIYSVKTISRFTLTVLHRAVFLSFSNCKGWIVTDHQWSTDHNLKNTDLCYKASNTRNHKLERIWKEVSRRYRCIKKGKISLNKPWRHIVLWDVEDPTFVWKIGSQMAVRLRALGPGHSLPPGRFLVLIPVRS